MPQQNAEKIKGKRKTQDPCEGCFLHRKLCICEFFPLLKLSTKLSLIIHSKELRRTTNTGMLAVKALANSEVFVRGLKEKPLDFEAVLDPAYRSLLFFPSDDAAELDQEFIQQSSKPIQLLVPDGNWRQASKIHYRYSELENLPRVMIKATNTATFHLRKESTAEGMATLQAIAYALGAIEGEPVQKALLDLYQLKLNRTLQGRGKGINTL